MGRERNGWGLGHIERVARSGYSSAHAGTCRGDGIARVRRAYGNGTSPHARRKFNRGGFERPRMVRYRVHAPIVSHCVTVGVHGCNGDGEADSMGLRTNRRPAYSSDGEASQRTR